MYIARGMRVLHACMADRFIFEWLFGFDRDSYRNQNKLKFCLNIRQDQAVITGLCSDSSELSFNFGI